MRGRKPLIPLQEAAANAAGELFKKQGFAETRLLTDWGRIAGDRLAAHSAPHKLSPGGVLHVRVESGFALEMQHLEPVLLERIASYLGRKTVTRLQLAQNLPPAKKNTPPPAPLPEVAVAETLTACLEPLAESPLKAALAALAKTLSAHAFTKMAKL